MGTDHSAAGPAVGYFYQAMFALLVLLDADEEASVSVETRDDVYLEAGEQRTLLQLKHSLQSAPPKVSVKSDLLWQALAVWCDADQDDSNLRFVLVTVGGIVDGDPAAALVDDSCRDAVRKALENEAHRVVDALREHEDSTSDSPAPFAKKASGARGFLALSKNARAQLVGRIYVRPNCPNAAQIEDEVASRLRAPPKHKRAAARNLIEWFDARVVRSLVNKEPARIRASEVSEWYWTFVRDRREDRLPDMFRTQDPPTTFLLPKTAAEQLSRIAASRQAQERAAKSYWRAMSQRNAWMDEDIMRTLELDEYDKHLVEEFVDVQKRGLSEVNPVDDASLRQLGRNMLEWSHFDAPRHVSPIRPAWTSAYLVRGTYQVLADVPSIYWFAERSEEEEEDAD